MTYPGTVLGGQIVLENNPQFPDGTQVEVEVLQRAHKTALREALLQLAGTVDDLPCDMAENHDHYIHGSANK